MFRSAKPTRDRIDTSLLPSTTILVLLMLYLRDDDGNECVLNRGYRGRISGVSKSQGDWETEWYKQTEGRDRRGIRPYRGIGRYLAIVLSYHRFGRLNKRESIELSSPVARYRAKRRGVTWHLII